MRIALDATYSAGDGLSGVGVYSREILWGVAGAHPEADLRFCYRPHRLARSFEDHLPPNAHRRLLTESFGCGPADLLHGLNQRLPPRRPRRSVATFHDLFVLTGEYSTPEFRDRFAAQARAAAARSDLIIAVSKFTAAQVAGLLGVEPSRLRVILHGVRPILPRPGPREPIVLHVGAIQKRKNVARLVEAFAALDSSWTLVLAGSLGFGAPEILAAADSSPVRDRIRVTGYLSRQKLDDLYARASILAFPSLDEGFGIPVMEAMAAGLPVLTSNRSALPEAAGDAALLVDPERTDEIAEGLRRLARDEELRNLLRERGLARAKILTWSAAVEKTWSVYRELI